MARPLSRLNEPVWRYTRTVLPAWLAGGVLSYVAIRMGLSEHYKLAFFATVLLTAVLSLNPGLQRLAVGFMAPLVIVLGFYSQWIPTMAEGAISPRQAAFLGGLDIAVVLAALAFLMGGVRVATRLTVWIILLFMATYLLAAFSGSAGGAKGMVEWMMETFHLDRATALHDTVVLRKTTHVTFYGTVAWSAFWSGWHGKLAGFRVSGYALAIALIMACFDETRQLGSPGRGGSGWDVLLDMAGASSAVLLSLILAGTKTRKKIITPLLETSP
jgi:hypothetical protein